MLAEADIPRALRRAFYLADSLLHADAGRAVHRSGLASDAALRLGQVGDGHVDRAWRPDRALQHDLFSRQIFRLDRPHIS